MGTNQFTQQGKQRSAISLSGKLFNDDDGLIGSILKSQEGQRSTPSGHCYDLLVVNQTNSQIMPRRQTWKAGQMFPCYRRSL